MLAVVTVALVVERRRVRRQLHWQWLAWTQPRVPAAAKSQLSWRHGTFRVLGAIPSILTLTPPPHPTPPHHTQAYSYLERKRETATAGCKAADPAACAALEHLNGMAHELLATGSVSVGVVWCGVVRGGAPAAGACCLADAGAACLHPPACAWMILWLPFAPLAMPAVHAPPHLTSPTCISSASHLFLQMEDLVATFATLARVEELRTSRAAKAAEPADSKGEQPSAPDSIHTLFASMDADGDGR